MLNENETKIRDLAGQSGTESPVETPAGVPRLSKRGKREKPLQVYYKDQPPGTVCVYIMTAGEWVKIGIAKDPNWRRAMLQCASPLEVQIVEARAFSSLSAARAVETEAHRILRDFRGHGEWFRISLQAAQNVLHSLSDSAVWVCTEYPRSPLKRTPEIMMDEDE